MEEIQDKPTGQEELLNNSDVSSSASEIPKEKESIPAQIISTILHPLLMGVYSVALLFFYADFNLIFAGQFVRFISPVFFFACIVPASGIYFLKKAELIKDYDVTHRQERFLPYLTTAFSYALLIYYFSSAKLSIWFIAVLTAPLALIIFAAVITHFWKISVHMMGIGGLIGCTLSVCYNVKGLNPYVLFIILFILAGILGVSRLILKRHTPAQVYIGFLAGLVISYFTVWIGAYWGVMIFIKNL